MMWGWLDSAKAGQWPRLTDRDKVEQELTKQIRRRQIEQKARCCILQSAGPH